MCMHVEQPSNLAGGTRGAFQVATQEFSWTLIEERRQTGYPFTCPAHIHKRIFNKISDASFYSRIGLLRCRAG